MPNRHGQPPPLRPSHGSLIAYGIMVATSSLLLLVILAATVSIVKACVLAGAVAALFSAAGCVSRWSTPEGAAAAPALPTTVEMPAEMPAAAPARAAFGLVDEAIEALPAFAYAPRPGTCGAEGSSSGKSGGRVFCPVCLEDVEAGEMVRQLPACAHLFHMQCIDMWLHSHATCPVCRCDVSPPQPVGAVKVTAAADPPDAALAAV